MLYPKNRGLVPHFDHSGSPRRFDRGRKTQPEGIGVVPGDFEPFTPCHVADGRLAGHFHLGPYEGHGDPLRRLDEDLVEPEVFLIESGADEIGHFLSGADCLQTRRQDPPRPILFATGGCEIQLYGTSRRQPPIGTSVRKVARMAASYFLGLGELILSPGLK